MRQDLRSLVFLHSLGFSQRALSRIFEESEDYAGFYNRLDPSSLQKLKLKEEKIQTVLEKKHKLHETKISECIERLGVRIVTVKDPDYPELLRETPVRPYFLYVRGELPSNTDLISVVGSRKSTTYSRAALSTIVPELVRNGYGIVSGGAYGVDSLAHRAALEHGGYTAAVFGTGIDGCYPRENKELFAQILASGGALISPFPLGTAPEQYNFPIRNEIVAGVSKGTLVTEAAQKSGTLITAGLALDFGRDVFALPGEITKTTSTGTNALIRDGQAKLVLGAADIVSEYQTMTIVTKKAVQPPKPDDPLEKSLYELIQSEPLDASSISDRLDIDIATVSFKLSMMEVSWVVEMALDGRYGVK